MTELFLNWIDFLWLPIVVIFLRKEQKLKGVIFVLACMLLLRLQVQLMTQIGYEDGFLPILSMPALQRGYIVYGIFIGLFLLLGHVSKERNTFVYLAAGISVVVFAFVASTGVMFL